MPAPNIPVSKLGKLIPEPFLTEHDVKTIDILINRLQTTRELITSSDDNILDIAYTKLDGTKRMLDALLLSVKPRYRELVLRLNQHAKAKAKQDLINKLKLTA